MLNRNKSGEGSKVWGTQTALAEHWAGPVLGANDGHGMIDFYPPFTASIRTTYLGNSSGLRQSPLLPFQVSSKMKIPEELNL